MNPTLQQLLWERIDTDPRLDEEAGLLILAAADGPEALEEALEGRVVGRAEPAVTAEQPAEPVGAYLGPVTVEGFRRSSRHAATAARPRADLGGGAQRLGKVQFRRGQRDPADR
jgi:hypothetical protein